MAKKPMYASTPAAPKKKVAATNPLGTVTIGTGKMNIVPRKPAQLHGLNIPPHSFRGASVKGATAYGRVARMKKQ